MAKGTVLAQGVHRAVAGLCMDPIPFPCLSFLIPSGAITVLINPEGTRKAHSLILENALKSAIER